MQRFIFFYILFSFFLIFFFILVVLSSYFLVFNNERFRLKSFLNIYFNTFLKNRPFLKKRLKKYIYFFLNLILNLKNFIYFFFKHYLLLLFVFFLLFLFLSYFFSIMGCERAPYVQVDSNAESHKYLADFYAEKENPAANIAKLCLSEAMTAVYAHGSFFYLTKENPRPFNLKRVIGKECFEIAQEFAQYLLDNSKPDTEKEVKEFLTQMFTIPCDSLHLYLAYHYFD